MCDVWSFVNGNLVSTLLGVMIGIPIALWVDRMMTSKRKREEGTKILSAMKDELSHNFGLMGQMESELSKGAVLFYQLDLSAWEATSEKRLDAVENYDLLRQISYLHYEYQHLARKVDLQLELGFGIMRAMSNYPEIRGALADAILVHIKALKPKTEQVISEIDAELSKHKR